MQKGHDFCLGQPWDKHGTVKGQKRSFFGTKTQKCVAGDLRDIQVSVSGVYYRIIVIINQAKRVV